MRKYLHLLFCPCLTLSRQAESLNVLAAIYASEFYSSLKGKTRLTKVTLSALAVQGRTDEKRVRSAYTMKSCGSTEA
jgi:hypothetical protein